LNSAGLKHGSEGGAELRVAIVQDKADRKQSAIDVVDGIASHLHHPILGGMWGDSGERDASRFQMQEEENVVGDQASPGEHFDGEEINTGQHGQMRPNKVCPVHLLAALGSRSDTEPAQDIADGLIGDAMAEIL
jgi:hypothetical protein